MKVSASADLPENRPVNPKATMWVAPQSTEEIAGPKLVPHFFTILEEIYNVKDSVVSDYLVEISWVLKLVDLVGHQ